MCRYEIARRGDGPYRDAEEERTEGWRYERSRTDLFYPVDSHPRTRSQLRVADATIVYIGPEGGMI